jgi:hypothetical protein
MAVCMATVLNAQSAKKKPTSKLYVADLVGDAEIDRGTEIDDLTKKSVFNAEGATLETKAKSDTTVVLSNGTGVFVDVDTRVQIKAFDQDAFRPNRTDLEDEPSVSRTNLYIIHGDIGVSTSRLAAGSTTTYETSLATASIRGRQAVIVAEDNLTVISMVQGEATVQAGPLGRPLLVKSHQQIIIRPGNPGEPENVEIQDIPDGQDEDSMQWLEYRVMTADSARKLVYFEVQARKGDGTDGDGSISLFDGSSNDSTGDNQIVAVPVAPANPPIDTNVSPANLISH